VATAMDSMLVILSLVEVVVAIWSAVLGCKVGACCRGCCCCNDSDATGPVLYAPGQIHGLPQGAQIVYAPGQMVLPGAQMVYVPGQIQGLPPGAPMVYAPGQMSGMPPGAQMIMITQPQINPTSAPSYTGYNGTQPPQQAYYGAPTASAPNEYNNEGYTSLVHQENNANEKPPIRY